MNRLSDKDRNLGPITLGSWNTSFSARISSGDSEDPGTHLLLTGFRRALRVKLPNFLKPCGKYGEWETEYGFSLSKEGNGYDFLQMFFGGQYEYGGPKNRKSWLLPWKQWKHIRTTLYDPDGKPFFEEEKGKWREYFDMKEKCPKVHFGFEDHDGEMIVATCMIEEREWHRGEGWFSWLKWFYPAKIRRSLDIAFSAETGPEKGSWKGGTIGTGIDMMAGETPRQAFERFCTLDHRSKYRPYRIKFIGPCGPPPPRPQAPVDNEPVQAK